MDNSTTNEEKNYRIAWRSKYTGYCGHGEWTNEDIAHAWARKLNKDWEGDIDHWVETKATGGK